MEYLIRCAQPSDLVLIPAIEKAAAQQYIPYLPKLGLTPEALTNIVSTEFLQQAQQQQQVWVATTTSSPQELAGFVVVDNLPDGFFIVELDVLPTYGRRGIGSALVNQVLRTARHQDYSTVTLTTFRHIPWTIPFYHRLGFEIVAPEHYTPNVRAIVNHEERYGFRRQVRVVMQCQLRPNPSPSHSYPD